MFYKKKGIPEENELVICTVKKILPHSIFVNLDEYENLEAMVHISEISPGRIRNLRDFVRENKVIVCKVLRIHQGNKHIDLSLRRVSIQQKKKKEEEYKQEERSEKVIELFAKNEKISIGEFYDKIGYKIIEDYGSLTTFFNEVITNEEISQVEYLKNKDGKSLINLIKEIIKPLEVELRAILTIQSKETNGIEIIKTTCKKTEEYAKKHSYNIKLNYISAPRYGLTVTANNFKDAEKILQQISGYTIEIAKSFKSEASWQKKS